MKIYSNRRYYKIRFQTIVWLTLFLFSTPIWAQIKIQGPNIVCLGNLASFKLINNSGQQITNYNWSFGNGNNSELAAPSILYKNIGLFDIECTVKFNNNSTAIARAKIEVLSLPKAVFTSPAKTEGYCTNQDEVCFKNESVASTVDRPLKKFIVTWGDGNLDIESSKIPIALCHNYEATGNFKIRFEVVDVKGCKNAEYQRILVVEGVNAQINTAKKVGCDSSTFCASVSVEPYNAIYSWEVNAKSQSINKYCQSITKKTAFIVTMLAQNPHNHCKDSVRILDTLDIAPNDITLVLNSNSICYNQQQLLAHVITATNASKIEWYVNNKLMRYNTDEIYLNPKSAKLKPGKYPLRCVVTFGSCQIVKETEFTVTGPVQKIAVWNNVQCHTNVKVFFVDSTISDSKRLSWSWSTPDGVSDSCTIWRSKNQNRYKNCIYTADFWGKHKYPSKFRGSIEFVVFDSATGCSDDTTIAVLIGDCGSCSGGETKFNLCQGDTFLKTLGDYFDPRYFSLDTGKTWVPFPSRIDKPYVGTYGISYILPRNYPNYAEEFGDDSFRLVSEPVTMDTLFFPDAITIFERAEFDTISVTAYGCTDCNIIVHFNNHLFKAGETLVVSWHKNEIKRVFYSDTIIDTIAVYSKLNGKDSLEVFYVSAGQCLKVYKLYAGCGMDLEIAHDSIDCFGKTHCIELKAWDNVADTAYSLEKSGLNYRLKWQNNWFNSQRFICQKIDTFGRIPLQFIATDSHGCTDTIIDFVKTQQVIAGVTKSSQIALCSELKQLFDSSYIYGSDSQEAEYLWVFTRTNRNSLLKDPIQLFEKVGNNHVKHKVISSYGCSDSIEFDIAIGKAKTYFTIPDTIGCVEFKAEFINYSTQSSTYIWEFGDPDQNILSTSDTQNISFVYKKPGIYNIKLTGVDTIYSALTGEAYYCNSEFPEIADSVRRITVLPYYKSALLGPDSICVGQPFVLESKTMNDVGFDIWVMPNGDKLKKKAGSTIIQTPFDKSGVYTFKVKPDYDWISGQPYCADTPSHSIHVFGIDADFSFLSPKNDGFYEFTNLSDKNAISFHWDFGHYNSANNTSTLIHPTHDYYPDTGTFRVCLEATNLMGCKDTICKNLAQTYLEYLYLANVFTPESTDGKNDFFDAVIDGENKYHLKIFNRWGEVVFESDTDANRFKDQENWNGKVQNTGPECPEGTYFYQFTYSFNRSPDKVKVVSGSVTLIR